MTKGIGLAGLVVAVVFSSTLARGQTVIRTVALKKDPSPEAGYTYTRFGHPVGGCTAEADVAFFARTRGTSDRRNGIFTDAPGAPGSTLVLIGDVGPDGRIFRRFGNPSMNAGGGVAFDAQLSNGGRGVFRGDQSVVALLGDPAPGLAGLLDGFSKSAITDEGDVVFRGTISGAAKVGGVALDEGLFRCTGGDGNCSSGTGSLEALVVRNDPVSDRPGREFCGFEEVAASSFGVVFLAKTKEDCANAEEVERRGVFRLPFGGPVVTVALQGEASQPFPEPGGTTYGVMPGSPDISNDGTVVFRARTSGIVVDQVLYLCVPAVCPAAPAEAAVSGGTGDPQGNVFRIFGSPVVSNAGHMAFKAIARGSSGTVRGLYVRRADGTLETVVSKDDIVPDLIPPTEFNALSVKTSDIDICSEGTIVFKAKVRSVDFRSRKREGVFIADVGGSPSTAFLDLAGGVVE